ncbi:MAG: YdcF family protein [Chloroflexi bacterium]|nr:YdcF family protein [Chloroflexota bacterium]
MAQIYHYSSKQDHQPADAAIVLGAAVYRERPSPVFRERINHAIELYQTGQVNYLIFTGGVGNRDAIAESEAARNYALQMGVPHEAILIETRSTNTTENLMQAKHLVGENDLGRVLVVSDPLHMKRAISIARDLGLDAYPSPTPTTRYRTWRSKSSFLIRETYFYSRYLLGI